MLDIVSGPADKRETYRKQAETRHGFHQTHLYLVAQ